MFHTRFKLWFCGVMPLAAVAPGPVAGRRPRHAGRGTSVARGTAPRPAPRLLGAGEPGPVRGTGSGFKLRAAF